MKTEKILFSFIAVLIGILITGVIFYFYQSTKNLSTSQQKTVSIIKPSPTPKATIFLNIDHPKDEDVTDKKTVVVSGKTIPEAVLLISTESTDSVVTPSSNGSFTTTITIGDDQNKLEITAIAPNGEEVKITRTITFSTENF